MVDRINNTKRLAKNTLMLYARMLFGLVVSLYTSRVILAALGESDYGIYNVVGGVVSMFSMLTTSLSQAISRFQTYELGKGDKERLSTAYSASFFLMLALSVIVFVLVESVGVWFLNTHMSIPTGRMGAANVVLQCTLVTFISSLLIVPYSASVVSHENMSVFAIISIAEVLFKLFIALFLAHACYEGDKLIVYAVLLVVSTIVIQIVYASYCHKHYEECHLKMVKFSENKVYKEILSFTGWNFLGNAASVLSNQGINIVLNMIYGPVVNTARGLAMTVNNTLANFVNNFTIALNPQIIKAYAAKEHDYLLSLVYRGAKFSCYIMLLLGLPVMLETEFLIDLWLVNVPDHTVNFVRLVMMLVIIDLFSNTLGVTLIATGKIRGYQISNGIVQIVYFLLAFFLLRQGFQPEMCYFIGLIVPLTSFFFRLYFCKKYVRINIVSYLKKVVLVVFFVMLLSAILPLFFHFTMEYGWPRFCLVVLTSLICTCVFVMTVGCSRQERNYVIRALMRVLSLFKKDRGQ